MSVKKATSLESLNELNLSEETLDLCKHMPITDLVSVSRRRYHFPPKTAREAGWLLEVEEALDSAGFIRHDFSPESFAVGRLYQLISHKYRDTNYVTDINDLRLNERYENYRNLSRDEIKAVIKALDQNLTKKEASMVKLRVGLGFIPEPMELPEIAKRMRIGLDEARAIWKSAFSKLWRPGILPDISQFATE